MAKPNIWDLKPGETKGLGGGVYVKRMKAGFSYFITYSKNGKRYRERAGEREADARKRIKIREGEILQGRFNEPIEKTPIPFSQFADEYLAHAKKKKRSWDRDRICVERFKAYFGSLPLEEITPALVDEYSTRRLDDFVPRTKRKVSKRTVNLELMCLKRMFNRAIELETFDRNPVKKGLMHKVTSKQMRVLQPEEQRLLFAALAPHMRPIVETALHTGMRWGELLSLRWSQVDMHRRVFRLEKTKTDEPRTVPINSVVYDLLLQLRKRGHIGHVFTFKGQPITSTRNAWQRAVKRAGIPHIRQHDLRHTFATRAARSGMEMPTLKAILGHHQITTTDRYMHTDEDRKQEAMEAMATRR